MGAVRDGVVFYVKEEGWQEEPPLFLEAKEVGFFG